MGLLVCGRVVNLFTPIYYKKIGVALLNSTDYVKTYTTAINIIGTFFIIKLIVFVLTNVFLLFQQF